MGSKCHFALSIPVKFVKKVRIFCFFGFRFEVAANVVGMGAATQTGISSSWCRDYQLDKISFYYYTG